MMDPVARVMLDEVLADLRLELAAEWTEEMNAFNVREMVPYMARWRYGYGDELIMTVTIHLPSFATLEWVDTHWRLVVRGATSREWRRL